MRNFHLHISSLGLALIILGLIGCNKSSTYQTSLPLAELPAAFEKAFSKARPEVRDLAGQFVKSVQAQDYPKAFQDIQNLTAAPGLTRDQSRIVGRGTLTINELLQSAQAKGDEKAATILENYRNTK